METTQRNSSMPIILILIVFIGIMALSLYAVVGGSEKVGQSLYKLGSGTELQDVPDTQHALDGHMDQEWNTQSITATINNGGCIPNTIRECVAGDTRLLWCKPTANPLIEVGLVIGKTVEQKITGFARKPGKWQKGCGR